MHLYILPEAGSYGVLLWSWLLSSLEALEVGPVEDGEWLDGFGAWQWSQTGNHGVRHGDG